MIKIIEKEVIKEYDVEPKVATLYFANQLNKDVIKVENCKFKEAKPNGWGANNANEYWLVYEKGALFRNVIIDIKTGIVKDDSDYFFDYEQAVKIHKARRIEFLKYKIGGMVGLKEYQQELEELEND